MNLFLPILLSITFSYMLDMVWYSDAWFGITWQRAMNKNKNNGATTKESGMALLGNLAMTTLTMIGVWIALHAMVLYNQTMQEGAFFGATVGALIWLVFIIPTVFQGIFFENADRSTAAIELGYRFLELIGAGIIMSFWL